MKFRKRPVEIEAVQWFKDGDHPQVLFSGSDDTGRKYYSIRTLEGMMRVNSGDWIICGIHGEFYPCKDDIFRATYDPVI